MTQDNFKGDEHLDTEYFLGQLNINGPVEGLMGGFDPLGIPIQWLGRQLGYDITTIGGYGFYGGEHSSFEKQGEDLAQSGWMGKAIMGGASFGSWFHPVGFAAHVAIQGVCALVNLYTNARRIYERGSLKLPEDQREQFLLGEVVLAIRDGFTADQQIYE